MFQSKQAQLAQQLAQHRQTMSDAAWLRYCEDIGFPTTSKTDEEKINDAVRFDAAESGLLPDWFYEDDEVEQ